MLFRSYIDRAISAKTDNRPQFQQMIKDSDKKLFDIVLVWKLDRFARNRYDSARYKTQLKKNGVKLMSATEIISEGPEGIILTDMFGGTPTNLALSLLGSHHVEVVTGVNLPMLLKVFTCREKPLAELARLAGEAGTKGIVVAGSMLRSRNKEKTDRKSVV